jgi:hypothetical protein
MADDVGDHLLEDELHRQACSLVEREGVQRPPQLLEPGGEPLTGGLQLELAC